MCYVLRLSAARSVENSFFKGKLSWSWKSPHSAQVAQIFHLALALKDQAGV
jgi:hypothetical protein